MVFFPSSELLLDPSPARVNNTLPGQLAKATARGAVAARVATPLPFLVRPRGAGLSGFALSLAWEAWNQFAQSTDAPPVAAMNFTAPGITSFTIQVTYRLKDNLIPPGTVTTVVGQLSSPIAGSPGAVSIGSTLPSTTAVVLDYTDPLGNPEKTPVSRFSYSTSRYEILSIENVDITDVSTGAPVPATYPFIQPVGLLPASPDVPLDLSIPRIPGATPVPLRIPIIIPAPSDLARNPIPVIYPSTIPEDQRRLLPQIWITPDGIQVGRGAQGDPVTVSIGDAISTGVNITLEGDYFGRNPPTVTTCADEPEPPGDCCDCEEIRQIVIEELDSKFPPGRPNSTVAELFPAANSRTVELPPFTKFVRLTIVALPQQVKSQFGGGDAPDVFYNGWYSLGATSSPSERIPLNYNDLSIPIPPNCRHFSYTIVGGGTASVAVYYQQPD